jgi:hypothetical protein
MPILNNTINSSLNNINQLRSIEWSKKYLWDVIFIPNTDKTLVPFDRWLPAVSVDDTVATIKSHQIQGSLVDFSIPLNQESTSITISFIDDINMTLYQWFKHWINVGIFNSGSGVSYIDKCLRTIQLQKLDNNLEPISTVVYLVYPISSIQYSGSSDTGNHTLEVRLQKVGVVRSEDFVNSSFSNKSLRNQIFNKIAGGVSYLNL